MNFYFFTSKSNFPSILMLSSIQPEDRITFDMVGNNQQYFFLTDEVAKTKKSHMSKKMTCGPKITTH